MQRLKQKAKQLKSETQVLIIVYKDKRTPLLAKVLIGITIGYLLSPIDLIPDFIPVLGVADDIILVSIVLGWVMQAAPREVIEEHWDGNTDLFSLLDAARDGINKLLGREASSVR